MKKLLDLFKRTSKKGNAPRVKSLAQLILEVQDYEPKDPSNPYHNHNRTWTAIWAEIVGEVNRRQTQHRIPPI